MRRSSNIAAYPTTAGTSPKAKPAQDLVVVGVWVSLVATPWVALAKALHYGMLVQFGAGVAAAFAAIAACAFCTVAKRADSISSQDQYTP